MDAQELRTLQEAYMEVYDNDIDEGFKEFPSKKVYKKAMNKPTDDKGWRQNFNMMDTRADFRNKSYDLKGDAKAASAANKNRPESEKRSKTVKEQADIYDIILSHLLDEGYAETEEAASAIMVNMSEEWRESIVEARKKVKIDTQKPIEYKIADIGPGKKEYNVKTSKGWKEEVEPDPFGRPGGKYGGVRKGGGYEKGYEAMKKKIKELEDKK